MTRRQALAFISLALTFGFATNSARAQCPAPISVACSAADLRAQIASAPDGTSSCPTVLQLASCTYNVSPNPAGAIADNGILVEGKRNLEIRGAGQGATVVHLTSAIDLGFQIRSGTKSLTIRSLTIEGEIASQNFAVATHGVASHSDVIGVENIRIDSIEARNLAVGISVGNAQGGRTLCNLDGYSGAVVENNYVHDIFGFDPGGRGYGIHSACAGNVQITHNIVRNAQRHSIYQGQNLYSNGAGGRLSPAASPKVNIIGNWSIDGRHGLVSDDDTVQTRAAIVASRSHNVSVVNNTIVRSHSRGIEVSSEFDFVPQNCMVIGNHFLVTPQQASAPGYYDIWFSGAAVRRWGNKRNANPGLANATILATESVDGQVHYPATDLGEPGGWNGTQWIEEMGGDLYVMNNGVLYRIPAPPYGSDPNFWPAVYSTTAWANFSAMAAMNGSIYLVQGGQIRRVTPQLISGAWPVASSTTSVGPGFQGMAAVGGFVYVIQSNSLKQVVPDTYDYPWLYSSTPITTDWGYAIRGGPDAFNYIARWDYISRYSNLSSIEVVN